MTNSVMTMAELGWRIKRYVPFATTFAPGNIIILVFQNRPNDVKAQIRSTCASIKMIKGIISQTIKSGRLIVTSTNNDRKTNTWGMTIYRY